MRIIEESEYQALYGHLIGTPQYRNIPDDVWSVRTFNWCGDELATRFANLPDGTSLVWFAGYWRFHNREGNSTESATDGQWLHLSVIDDVLVTRLMADDEAELLYAAATCLARVAVM